MNIKCIQAFVYLLFIQIIKSIDFNFTLRNLDNQGSEYPLILVDIFLGSPFRKFTLIADTEWEYTTLLSSDLTLSKASRYYKPSESTTSKKIGTETKLISSDHAVGVGYEIKDQFTLYLARKTFEMSFLSMESFFHPLLNKTADGILGLGNNYNELTYSFFDNLYINRFIYNKVFSVQFMSENKGIISFGDNTKRSSQGKFCKVDRNSKKWDCMLKEIHYGKTKLPLEEKVSISTGTYESEFYHKVIFDMLNHYEKLFNNYSKKNECSIPTQDTYKRRLICKGIQIKYRYVNKQLFRV